jgi:hypothetical protein
MERQNGAKIGTAGINAVSTRVGHHEPSAALLRRAVGKFDGHALGKARAVAHE